MYGLEPNVQAGIEFFSSGREVVSLQRGIKGQTAPWALMNPDQKEKDDIEKY